MIFCFCNAEDNKVSVLYKRQDGNYGLFHRYKLWEGIRQHPFKVTTEDSII